MNKSKLAYLERHNTQHTIDLASTSGIKAAVKRNVFYSTEMCHRERNLITKF